MSLPKVRSDHVTEAELKITQPIMSSARASSVFKKDGTRQSILVKTCLSFVNVSETGHRKSLKTSRTQTAEEGQGEDNCTVGRNSTSLDPLRLSSGSGQRSFTFSASAQAGPWGHQSLMLGSPPWTTSSLHRLLVHVTVVGPYYRLWSSS